MIRVIKVIAATNTDILAGTALQSMPEDGTLVILVGSTQLDSAFTATVGDTIQVDAQPILQRANGVPNLDDPVLALEVLQGQRVKVAITIVTAATCVVIAEFAPA